MRASGRCARSHWRHWARPCGCEQTTFTSLRSPARESRCWLISRVSSPVITVSDSMRRSRVTLTGPSVEFSTGTTPYSARARSTSGPSGPRFSARRRSRSCASRSGTKYGESCCRLSSPIWRAACPRWLRRLRICSSRSLILERQSSRSIRAPDADLSANSAKYRRTPWAAQVLQPGQLVDGEPTRLSRGERAEAERAEADTTEPHHRMLEGSAVTLDLAIAPFTERELDPRGLRAGAEEAHAGGDSGAVRQHDTATPARKLAGARSEEHTSELQSLRH